MNLILAALFVAIAVVAVQGDGSIKTFSANAGKESKDVSLSFHHSTPNHLLIITAQSHIKSAAIAAAASNKALKRAITTTGEEKANLLTTVKKLKKLSNKHVKLATKDLKKATKDDSNGQQAIKIIAARIQRTNSKNKNVMMKVLKQVVVRTKTDRQH